MDLIWGREFASLLINSCNVCLVRCMVQIPAAISYCNLILDDVPNPKLIESILSELVVMVPIVAKLIWFTDGELVSHKSVQQFSIKHVLVCELTAGSPLQKKHVDATDLFGLDKFVFYLGEYLTLEQLRAFGEKHRRPKVLKGSRRGSWHLFIDEQQIDDHTELFCCQQRNSEQLKASCQLRLRMPDH